MPKAKCVRRPGAPEFSEQYARAKDESAHAHSERILEVVDRVLSEDVNPNAARVAIDAVKWTASRLLPKRYGDRLDANLTGDITVIVDKVHQDQRAHHKSLAFE